MAPVPLQTYAPAKSGKIIAKKESEVRSQEPECIFRLFPGSFILTPDSFFSVLQLMNGFEAAHLIILLARGRYDFDGVSHNFPYEAASDR
jgi:hypothetical protein